MNRAKNVVEIIVCYWGDGDRKQVGRLIQNGRQYQFEYDSQFLSTGLELSPFKLPLKQGTQTGQDVCFEGLFGLFNDSLPDGWGRLLLDRSLARAGINIAQLTPLDRLRYVGSSGMGALSYEPVINGNLGSYPPIDFDQLSDESRAFLDENDDQYAEDLLRLNGSSAGARPKVCVDVGGESWIVKFRSSTDLRDIGPIEYAYWLMAKEVGLDVPDAKLFPSRRGSGFFGCKRFDRNGSRRVHMHSISGLLGADHRLPSLDYEEILKATSALTKSSSQVEQQFRRAVFNVLIHNRDDHAKNFSFLMSEGGSWKLSPAYDMTFSSGPAGEHCTTIMGEGKYPAYAHLNQLAASQGIAEDITHKIIQEVSSVVKRWDEFSKSAGVSETSRKMIKAALSTILDALKEIRI